MSHVQLACAPVGGLKVSEPLVNGEGGDNPRVRGALEEGIEVIPIGMVANRPDVTSLPLVPPSSIPPRLVDPAPLAWSFRILRAQPHSPALRAAQGCGLFSETQVALVRVVGYFKGRLQVVLFDAVDDHALPI